MVVAIEQPPETGDAGPDAAPNADGIEPAAEKPTGATSREQKPKSSSRRARSTTRSRAKRTKKSSAAVGQAAKFPRHSVERALRIPQAIYDQNAGNPATLQEAVKFTGGNAVSGPFRAEVSSSKKYGFLESVDSGKVAVTARARKAIAPQAENDRRNALREAVLAAPDLSDVYSFYRGESLPDQQFFVNALTDRFDVPAEKVPEFITVFNESMRAAELIDEGGDRPRLLDIGRDEEQRRHPPTARAQVDGTGKVCFVMQPFAGHLGGYYDLIYRPAIEQAGLQAMRADAEIFGTGKIMDQIWRGIHGADVLVAELTSKNANVFYELGLAHALEKPVVLVSSNEEDVPFDLRHIRVILYDQTDPFWGQKLVDKIADNIRSALSNPEDAIFRVADE